jgi:hypothetical protein
MKDFTKKLGTETKAKLYSLFKKGKVTAREVQWNPETSNSLLRLGGFFSLGVDLQAFSGELVCTFIGGRETILGAFCSSALWQIYQTL